MTERVLAPFGRRVCEVVDNHASGGYRVFSLRDGTGPAPAAGQFYMLATERGWQQRAERPFLPRAFSVADAEVTEEGLRLDFLVEGVGPGTERLCGLKAGEGVWLHGPLGRPFGDPRDLVSGAAGAILVGGGIGVAPLAILRRQLTDRGVPTRILLGFRDREHSGGVEDLFACCEVRLASEDGHVGHQGYVTDLLAVLLEGGDAGSGVVYCVWAAGDAGGRAGCFAPPAGWPASWRWNRRWHAATAPVSAARCRFPTAATCASASTDRSSVARRSKPRWSQEPDIDEPRGRLLRDPARAPGDQRLRDL